MELEPQCMELALRSADSCKTECHHDCQPQAAAPHFGLMRCRVKLWAAALEAAALQAAALQAAALGVSHYDC